MSEMNFCPFCGASSHKVLLCKDNIFFCKDCSKFFRFEEISLKCPKCDATEIMKSDFPSPKGEAVFQCKSCKKALSASEFLKSNNIR